MKGYFRTVAQLSREEFDAIEFGAARTGDHRSAALRMSQLADTLAQTGEMSRAEAHLRAGEQWLLAETRWRPPPASGRHSPTVTGRSSMPGSRSPARCSCSAGTDEAWG